MARTASQPTTWKALCMGAMLMTGVLGDQILTTTGFTDCGSLPSITIQQLSMTYDNDAQTITFDIQGTSSSSQNVSATLDVTAYGISAFTNTFNPCDPKTMVAELCPLPNGPFVARGTQKVPAQYASMIPGIAFSVPDISALAIMKLNSLGSSNMVACIQAQVTNGKTMSVPAVSYVAASIAGVSLAASGLSAIGTVLHGGAASSSVGVPAVSPSFADVAGWFQGMAMSGMLSVNYPPIYRNFAKNFAFSVGLIPWNGLLGSIDDFRAKTGGNLTEDSVAYLRNLTVSVEQKNKMSSSVVARLVRRDDAAAGDAGFSGQITQTISGVKNFAESLSVPKSDVFMTALLIVAIVIASIVTGILLVKVILEVWSLYGKFPESLTGFRKHYWRSIARTITSLILLLYGIWVLYCVFQFTLGDSWAAKTLAGVSLALFTGVLLFFGYKIWSTAHRLKREHGDAARLYEDKQNWIKYSMFYEAYQKSYWWLFIPVILYTFAKGCLVAAGDGHGMAQTAVSFVIEAAMLALLVWSRPFERRSSNIINIIIAVVRVLSVICVFVFVEEFGIQQTTQTVMGVVMIAVQSTLTGALAILVLWNAINATIKMNPHRKRRKELGKFSFSLFLLLMMMYFVIIITQYCSNKLAFAEKQREDMDDLTPLDARNTMLIRSKADLEASMYPPIPSDHEENLPPYSKTGDRYYAPSIPESTYHPALSGSHSPSPMYRDLTGARQAGDSSPSYSQDFFSVGVDDSRPNSRTSTRGPSPDGRDLVQPHDFVGSQKYSGY
ncbi:transient receptor potential ion channel [Trichoderma arundinaceum]|uniref:Transient receptor potential ion channel n=1 Tax=Trichoderma arundinaceum TaxID=490622 RepID=A0A395P0G5_TRIAR|nr:transient receptor potential ion channel [Trichoderma arundinaceum]